MNHKRGIVLLIALVAASCTEQATAAEKTPSIYDVAIVVGQHCGKPTWINYEPHPQRQRVRDTGVLILGKTGYRVDLSQLSEFRDWMLMERLNDTSRGVDDSYVLFTRDSLSPFEAAYVITPLPEQMRQTDGVLQTVASMQQANADGGKVSFIKADTPFGPGLEMIVGGRIGSACFPTSHFVYATAESPSIGISRFVVRDETLIEYSLVMRWPDGLDQDVMVKQAQQRMDAFQRGLIAESGA